jgi:RNA polymerase sigma-70 factor (ECF subfamily)
MDERQAIARLKKGDLSGLEYLVRAHQLRALRTAYLIVQDRDLAEDIVQNAFLKVSEKIATFDASLPFEPWFLRIVINAAIKAAQRQKRFISINGDEEAERLEILEGLAADLPHPEQFVETEETRREVWQMLQQLTPKQRAVIVLRYYLGMTANEMAGELDSSLAAIKWSLHAARERLRGLLRPTISDTAFESHPGPIEDRDEE